MGVDRPKIGIGFPPEAGRDGFVCRGVFACSLECMPQVLDEGQTLASVIVSWGKHARGVLVEMTKLNSRDLDYAPSEPAPVWADVAALVVAEARREWEQQHAAPGTTQTPA